MIYLRWYIQSIYLFIFFFIRLICHIEIIVIIFSISFRDNNDRLVRFAVLVLRNNAAKVPNLNIETLV